jgi:hypothetical protein
MRDAPVSISIEQPKLLPSGFFGDSVTFALRATAIRAATVRHARSIPNPPIRQVKANAGHGHGDHQ